MRVPNPGLPSRLVALLFLYHRKEVIEHRPYGFDHLKQNKITNKMVTGVTQWRRSP